MVYMIRSPYHMAMIIFYCKTHALSGQDIGQTFEITSPGSVRRTRSKLRVETSDTSTCFFVKDLLFLLQISLSETKETQMEMDAYIINNNGTNKSITWTFNKWLTKN